MLPKSSILFVSKAGVDSGAIDSYNLQKRIEVVKNCRTVRKQDMKFNGEMPEMKVDPELYVRSHKRAVTNPYYTLILESADDERLQTVEADGKACKAEAASSLPLTHQYFMY